jgi:hypothetical protein
MLRQRQNRQRHWPAAKSAGLAGAVAGVFLLLQTALMAETTPAPAGGQPYPEAVLYGHVEPEQGRVRLYWETRNWPQWLEGYAIKSRSGQSDWSDLHADVIRPNFHPVRDWSNQGLTEAEVAALLAAREATFGQRIPDRPAEEVLALLRRYDGLQSGDRLSQKMDYNIALFSGFAYIDHVPGGAGQRAYGLFPVDREGTVSPEPVSTWQARPEKPVIEQPVVVEQSVSDGVIVLEWKYAREEARQQALFGFRIYRQDKATGEWINLVETPIGSIEGDADSLHFNFYDTLGNPTEDQIYVLQAVNMFQQSFGQTESAFQAERFRPLPRPQIASHRVVNDADVLVEWSYPEKAAGRVKGFYVERAQNGTFNRISALLPPDTRNFADDGYKEYSQVYDYRVVAVDKWDKEWSGSRIILLYLGQSRPPQPTNLKGSLVIQKGQPGILLQWEPTPAADKRTRSFRILSDVNEPGNLLLQSQIEAFSGNRFFFPLKTNGGRWIEMGLLPITGEGITGDPATVEVYMPIIKLPPVTGVASSFDRNSYSVELSWDYPTNLADLSGFRVLMDGKAVPGIGELPADARSAVISSDTFKKGETYRLG